MLLYYSGSRPQHPGASVDPGSTRRNRAGRPGEAMPQWHREAAWKPLHCQPGAHMDSSPSLWQCGSPSLPCPLSTPLLEAPHHCTFNFVHFNSKFKCWHASHSKTPSKSGKMRLGPGSTLQCRPSMYTVLASISSTVSAVIAAQSCSQRSRQKQGSEWLFTRVTVTSQLRLSVPSMRLYPRSLWMHCTRRWQRF